MTVHDPEPATLTEDDEEAQEVNVDAFGVDPDSDHEAEEHFNAEHDEEGRLVRIPQDEGSDDAYEGAATLHDLRVSNASNGKNYTLKFEIDREIGQVFFEERSGHDVFWRGIKIGSGVSVKNGTLRHIADGKSHRTMVLQMSEDWARRSGAKILSDDLVGLTGRMRLQPMQMALDLVTRAE
jgi:hypothetical protein